MVNITKFLFSVAPHAEGPKPCSFDRIVALVDTSNVSKKELLGLRPQRVMAITNKLKLDIRVLSKSRSGFCEPPICCHSVLVCAGCFYVSVDSKGFQLRSLWQEI